MQVPCKLKLFGQEKYVEIYRAAKSHGLPVSLQVFALTSRSHGGSCKSHGLPLKWSFMHGFCMYALGKYNLRKYCLFFRKKIRTCL